MMAPCCVQAWGDGHVDWQRSLHEILPSDFMARIDPETAETAIRHWSKYIDSFESFEPEFELIGPEGLALLERYGITRRYDLHGERARAVAFLLIVEALRAGRYEAALFWIANFGHSVADMPAGNHDPLLHLATYDWAVIDLSLSGGTPVREVARTLDLSHSARHPEGAAAFAAATERMRIEDDGRDAREALLEIMRYGHEGAAYLAARGPAIWDAAIARGLEDGEATRAALFEPVAELGAWALVRVARDVKAALRIAASGESLPELDEELLAEHAEWLREHVSIRAFEGDQLFAPLRRHLPGPEEGGAEVVGVVLEPVWRMNEAMFGFSDRTLAAMVCRSLDAVGRPHLAIDLREVLAEGFPDPAVLPAVVVAARRLNSYHGLRREDFERVLEDYRSAGGRVLWIGGHQRPVAAEVLAAAMEPEGKGDWPLPEEELPGSRLVLGGGSGEWTMWRHPFTRAGWHRPYGRLGIDPEAPGVEPLLELQGGERKILVGAVERVDGRPPFAWLPAYALHPWILTEPGEVEPEALLALDPAGTAILEAALAALEDPR